jgi:hypothetical protein
MLLLTVSIILLGLLMNAAKEKDQRALASRLLVRYFCTINQVPMFWMGTTQLHAGVPLLFSRLYVSFL